MVQLKQIESATEEEKQTAKDWQQVEEIIRGNPYREAVKQEMYKMSQDEKERYLYLREEMAVSDEVSRMRTAIKEGIKRGIKLTKKVFQLSQKGCIIAQIAEKCNIEESEVKDTIRGLVSEIASIHMSTYSNTELNEFKNKSVSYMVSKKYGMPLADYDFSKIPQELQQMSPKEIKAELAKVAECYQILVEGIDRTLDIQPKAKSHREYER